MTDQTDLSVIDVLKRTMRRRSLRLTDMAERSGVPYRSLQNYFSRRTQMPVTVYLKLCGVLGLDANYVEEERFKIDRSALKVAFEECLGHLVPHYVTENEAVVGIDPRTIVRTPDVMRIDLDILSTLVIGRYDQERETELSQTLSDDEDKGVGEVPQ